MSLFGQPAQAQPSTGGLFGSSTQGGGLFGSSTTQQQQQQAPSSGLFGGLASQPKPQSSGLFGQSTATQQQPSTGLFGASMQQSASTGLFGANQNLQQQQQQQQQNQQQSGGGSLFGPTPQQQQPPSSGLFGSSGRQGLSIYGQNPPAPREKSVPEQIQTVAKKWLPGESTDCVFQHYFYNKVDEKNVPFYQPNANEDPKAWEEALGNKPGPGYIPVLCTGYEQLGQRIKIQQLNLVYYNKALHHINDKLTACLHSHETSHSIRAMDAKRKHALLRQRCLRIATKVQVLRNRGYALGGDEEDLRTKLQELEKKANDPGLGARAEEIWARMLTVQERAKVLKNEIERSGKEAPDMLDEDTTKKAKKILEDYDRQLVHLKKEMDTIQKEYEEWEKSQKVAADSGRTGSYRASVR